MTPADDPRRPHVVDRLVRAGCVAADEEADELLAATADAAVLDGWLARREAGEPLPWLTGRTSFCGRPLHVRPGVYVPRPHTQDLARRAAVGLPRGGRALDLCTGTGAIAAHLAAHDPTAVIVGVDLDHAAAACARSNGVMALAADLDAALRPEAMFDVITAVAPYVPTGHLHLLPRDVVAHEPRLALDGGSDGLDLVRRIVDVAARRLRPGGWLLLEIGGAQDDVLARHLAARGFSVAQPWHDEDGDVRGLAARRPG